MVREVSRVLAPGGLLRIVVPDLELIARLYVGAISAAEPERGAFAALIPEYDTPSHKLNAYFSKHPRREEIPARALRTRLSRWADLRFGAALPHQWMYDLQDLTNLLKEAGFRGITKQAYRRGEMPDLDVLDIERHRDESLYVEARTPGLTV